VPIGLEKEAIENRFNDKDERFAYHERSIVGPAGEARENEHHVRVGGIRGDNSSKRELPRRGLLVLEDIAHEEDENGRLDQNGKGRGRDKAVHIGDGWHGRYSYRSVSRVSTPRLTRLA